MDTTLLQESEIYTFPTQRGTYALHLRLDHPERMKIGRGGEFSFPLGDYLYVGSALGPGGLKARLARHLRGKNRCHWHIDWLKEIMDAIGVFYLTSVFHYECKWSQFLLNFPQVIVPAAGFGASDCRKSKTSCAAHLLCFEAGLHAKNLCGHLSEISGLEVTYHNITSNSQSDQNYLE